MRLGTPVVRHKPRLEIIPLIDIMFFLLAAFMMVSITMIRVQALKMDLPTPTAAQAGKRPDMIHLEIDAIGDAYVVAGGERQRMSLPDLHRFLTDRRAASSNVQAYIKGSPEATHGQVIAVLDSCRRAGIEKVSFNLTRSRED
jgi:biopolymer transport protein ExbD